MAALEVEAMGRGLASTGAVEVASVMDSYGVTGPSSFLALIPET